MSRTEPLRPPALVLPGRLVSVTVLGTSGAAPTGGRSLALPQITAELTELLGVLLSGGERSPSK